jgi:hypothetical protein
VAVAPSFVDTQKTLAREQSSLSKKILRLASFFRERL